VYVREAHPIDGWRLMSNDRARIAPRQPTTEDERRGLAQQCSAHLLMPMPVVVDTLDDAVGCAYSGMPDRLYLLDRDGRVVYRSGRGPFGFHPGELEQALILLLYDEARAARG
jgi:hypothetical protein